VDVCARANKEEKHEKCGLEVEDCCLQCVSDQVHVKYINQHTYHLVLVLVATLSEIIHFVVKNNLRLRPPRRACECQDISFYIIAASFQSTSAITTRRASLSRDHDGTTRKIRQESRPTKLHRSRTQVLLTTWLIINLTLPSSSPIIRRRRPKTIFRRHKESS
jgi:hypothetical protein